MIFSGLNHNQFEIPNNQCEAKRVLTLSAFVFLGVPSYSVVAALPTAYHSAIQERKHAPWSALWFPVPALSLRPSSPRERAGRYSSRGPRRGMRQGECPSLGKETTDLTSRPAGGASGVPETGHAVSQKRAKNECSSVLTACCKWEIDPSWSSSIPTMA